MSDLIIGVMFPFLRALTFVFTALLTATLLTPDTPDWAEGLLTMGVIACGWLGWLR